MSSDSSRSLLFGALAGGAGILALSHLVGGWCPVRDGLCPAKRAASTSKPPKIVVVTGAAGNIGYSIVFPIASGRMLGEDQPVILRLLDLPDKQPVLEGYKMELDDCAYPLLHDVQPTSDVNVAFRDADVVLLIGARPRTKGMDRRDLLVANAEIFKHQGKVLNDVASRNVKVLVVGNPANTNARICIQNAPDLPKSAFSAMTRLDQNRAVAQLSKRVNVGVDDIHNVIIWGNHSNTQYPDTTHAFIKKGKQLQDVNQAVNDDAWLKGDFIKTVQTRGGAIIEILQKSSAASAANAAVEHVRDWVLGTNGRIVSMAVHSDGQYGVRKGLVFSFPCVCDKGEYRIVDNFELDNFSKEKLKISEKELIDEETDAGVSS